MAHLWQRDESGHWQIVPLDGDMCGIEVSPFGTLRFIPGEGADGLQVVRVVGAAGAEQWVLLMPESLTPSVRINGLPALLGLHILQDRDELYLGGICVYFATEMLAKITPFQGTETAKRCPRCQQEIAQGVPAVQCPQCHVWYHQSADDGLECWTYTDTCALDNMPTALTSEFRWTPEVL